MKLQYKPVYFYFDASLHRLLLIWFSAAKENFITTALVCNPNMQFCHVNLINWNQHLFLAEYIVYKQLIDGAFTAEFIAASMA